MNEKARLFLFVLCQTLSYHQIEGVLDKMEYDYRNEMPKSPFPPFKEMADWLERTLGE
jgi:hypothetical protein